ncbi:MULTISPECIES: hypothetical protein [unclassified Streptomyces]|uniref:hypothetical protein n=1 Tax=unclassified Streptomyces TaxID=2593676 RepID=UPI0033B5B30C
MDKRSLLNPERAASSDLKGRAEGETRIAPGHPALTRILRQHTEDEQLKPGVLLFRGESGGTLAVSERTFDTGTGKTRHSL